MSACEVVGQTDFPIQRTNSFQAVIDMIDSMLAENAQDQKEQIAKLREAIVYLRQLQKKPVLPGRIYLDLPERLLWNWFLDQLQSSLVGLEAKIDELEQVLHEVTGNVRSVMESLGNPATLRDVAALMREGVSQLASDLSKEVTLTKLAADNEWRSEAADAYAERAQLQIDEGLDELAASAQALANFLDDHAATELNFWEGFSGLIINTLVFLAGVVFTFIGVVAMIVGLVAALPTAGIGLVVTVLGAISTVGGVIVTIVSGLLLVKSFNDLMDSAEQALAAGVDRLALEAVPAGHSWPILAR